MAVTRARVPASSHFPELHSRLDDGRLSPATVPLGAAAHRDLDDSHDSPSFIYDLDSLDATCHPNAQRAASAVVASRAFLALLNDPATTPTGRARLLDGSAAKGPFTWLRRLPIPSSDPCDTPFFAFQVPQHFPVAGCHAERRARWALRSLTTPSSKDLESVRQRL